LEKRNRKWETIMDPTTSGTAKNRAREEKKGFLERAKNGNLVGEKKKDSH